VGISAAVLPNPFVFLNGTTVKSKADWACRREQLRALFQKYEQGDKPSRPEVLKSSFSVDALTITAGIGVKTIDFRVPIKLPSVGKAPYPAIIMVQNRSTIPVPAGVATITLPVDVIALQSTRGKGVFYDLYGKNATASTLLAWGWAVSRVIDILESTPSLGIDPTKIGVAGCSRYGKGALVAGAFNDRIALTIPQESGCGGAGCWWIAQELKNQGKDVEVASNLAGTSWVAASFQQYSTASAIGTLPVDHHELAGIIAPRGLYATSADNDWLGMSGPFQCMSAANQIYKALGVKENQGFAKISGHKHCQFPASEVPELNAFIQKFLFRNESVSTDFFSNKMGYKFEEKWTPWEVPKLL
jgi:hypothetical protein